MKDTISGAVAALATLAVLAGPLAAHGVDKGRFGGRDGFHAALFGLLDGNDDEGITIEEINATWVALFGDADPDGDGRLSAEELAGVIGFSRTGRRRRRIETWIESQDSDGDGLLSLDEATAAARPEHVERVFRRFDSDGDEMVTRSEMDGGDHGRWQKRWRKYGH